MEKITVAIDDVDRATVDWVRHQFDEAAPTWDANAEDSTEYFTSRMPFVCELVARHARGRACLDVGCAAGTLACEPARRGATPNRELL